MPAPNTTQVEPASTLAVFMAAPRPVERPHANRHARSSGASGSIFASAICGITVYSAKVEVPMKWRICSPPRASRVVPSGRWPLFCSARMGWGLATIAGVAGKGETLDVIPRWLITGRRIAGSSFGGVKGRDQVPQLVERWLAGEIDVDSFVSHRLTLDDVNRGFELMEAQDGIRSVIEFN